MWKNYQGPFPPFEDFWVLISSEEVFEVNQLHHFNTPHLKFLSFLSNAYLRVGVSNIIHSVSIFIKMRLIQHPITLSITIDKFIF